MPGGNDPLENMPAMGGGAKTFALIQCRDFGCRRSFGDRHQPPRIDAEFRGKRRYRERRWPLHQPGEQPQFLRIEIRFGLRGKPGVDAPAIFVGGETGHDALQFLERGRIARHRERFAGNFRPERFAQRNLTKGEGENDADGRKNGGGMENRMEGRGKGLDIGGAQRIG